jgi:hypothetical protein
MLQINEGQMRQIRKICRSFEEHGIDYMLLKGCRMKQMYPAPELRTMSDADILIRKEQYESIRPLMEALGFQPGVESDHEYVWEHPRLYLELHKSLIPTYNRDFYSYFGDGWHLARQEQGSCYGMTLEDQFLYELTHFAKHFRDGGIGIRHVTDLWIYSLRHPELEGERLWNELKKLKLDVFYGKIRHLIQVWFGDAPEDETSEFLTAYIFASGNYGQAEERFLSDVVRRMQTEPGLGKKGGFVLDSIFPSVKALAPKYTILRKHPWLLPAIWVYRPFYKLICERDSVKMKIDRVELITEDNLKRKEQMLRAMGLEFR